METPALAKINTLSLLTKPSPGWTQCESVSYPEVRATAAPGASCRGLWPESPWSTDSRTRWRACGRRRPLSYWPAPGRSGTWGGKSTLWSEHVEPVTEQLDITSELTSPAASCWAPPAPRCRAGVVSARCPGPGPSRRAWWRAAAAAGWGCSAERCPAPPSARSCSRRSPSPPLHCPGSPPSAGLRWSPSPERWFPWRASSDEGPSSWGPSFEF